MAKQPSGSGRLRWAENAGKWLKQRLCWLSAQGPHRGNDAQQLGRRDRHEHALPGKITERVQLDFNSGLSAPHPVDPGAEIFWNRVAADSLVRELADLHGDFIR